MTDGKLVVAAADGSEPQVLADAMDGTTTGWSPGGDRVAFTAGLEDEQGDVTWSELRVIDLASEAVTTLVRADDGDRLWVNEFSPEGDRILFGRIDRGWESLSSWSTNAFDGSNTRQLVSGTHDADWQSVLATPARRAVRRSPRRGRSASARHGPPDDMSPARAIARAAPTGAQTPPSVTSEASERRPVSRRLGHGPSTAGRPDMTRPAARVAI